MLDSLCHNWISSDQKWPLEGNICILLWRCACESQDHTKVTHHGNGVWGKQLLGTHGRDVGDVGEDVNESDEGDGDEDGTGEVPGDNKIRRV